MLPASFAVPTPPVVDAGRRSRVERQIIRHAAADEDDAVVDRRRLTLPEFVTVPTAPWTMTPSSPP